MSIRGDIIDGFVSALSTSTGITTVKRQLSDWSHWDADEFPGVTVLDGRTQVVRSSFGDTGMEADMDVEIVGYAHAFTDTDLPAARINLIEAVQKAIYTSTHVMSAGGMGDIMDVMIAPDRHQAENFATFTVTATVKFFFASTAP